LYRYGLYCYNGRVNVGKSDTLQRLPALLDRVQAVQGELPYVNEYDLIPASEHEGKYFTAFSKAMEFILEEVGNSEEILAEEALDEGWIDADGGNMYFEFETRQDYSLNGAEVVFAKTFTSDIMCTIIYFGGRFMVSLSEKSDSEQALVDTLFPQIYGKRRGVTVAAYDHPQFTRLSLWEASEPVPDAEELEAQEEAAIAAAAEAAMRAETDDMRSPEGAYGQVYMVAKPHALEEGSTAREAFFGFGDWCYAGEVDLGVEALNLADVPALLPTLQQQQGALGYLCDISTVPRSSRFHAILKHYNAAIAFMQAEIVNSEPELARLSELGVTSWIDQDWAASFFELALLPSMALEDAEVIASKTYLGTGVVLHCVYFEGSLYAVLSDPADDVPLLDVAFPDVTARCRGVQVRTYSVPTTPRLGDGPRYTKLAVWEGRRKGAAGVGWGVGSIIPTDGMSGLRHVDAPVERSAGGTVRDSAGKREGTASVASSREDEGSRGGGGGAVGSSGAGDASASTDASASSPSRAPRKPAPLEFQARAPHHLPPMQASSPGGKGLVPLRKLGPVGGVSSSLGVAPWDARGKPLGK
jgi:hypothetical protein